MADQNYVRFHDWAEPAHPAIVKQFEDLVAIYTRIRDQFQQKIDDAFDRVSRQIGFVVTTTVPIVLDIGKGNANTSISIGAEHLKGTLFENAVIEAIKDIQKPASPGKYNLYLFWYDALRIKLRTDWMEPAHFLRGIGGIQPKIGEMSAARAQESLAHIRWDVREPAHWFDPGIAIGAEEAILIDAIDQVYTDLHLVERVAYYRQAQRRTIRPEVQEPAHFRR